MNIKNVAKFREEIFKAIRESGEFHCVNVSYVRIKRGNAVLELFDTLYFPKNIYLTFEENRVCFYDNRSEKMFGFVDSYKFKYWKNKSSFLVAVSVKLKSMI